MPGCHSGRGCYKVARVTATTIAELVVERAADERIGLYFEDQSWSWGEVVRECAARAALLDDLRSDGPFHVGVLLDNVPDYVFLLGGSALAGATVVGINPTRRGAELAADIRHTDCQLIITEPAHLVLLDGLDLGVPTTRVLSVESSAWRSLVDQHQDVPRPQLPPAPDALFVLIFTSGSTGAPKAVRGTQGRFAALGASMPFTSDDVLYCPMPLFHGNALASNFVPALATGATIALRRKFSASEFLPDLRRFRATYFNMVGRALSYVLATPPAPDDRDHCVKFALAPESSPADVRAFRERFGIPIVQGYGQSEGAIVLAPARGKQRGALGSAAPGHDIAVVDPETGQERTRARFDDHGRLLNAADAIGEIVRRDSSVRFEGYYKNPAAAAERMRNGWYWSGDLAYRDTDGVFYFAGRSSDWIRVDAENFAAAPVERIIARHPDVAAVAVYGVPDPVTGDQVMAAIESRAGRAFDPDAFRDFLDGQRDLGTKWAPRFVRIVDSLPTIGADKIDKKPLRLAAWSTSDPVWWQPARGEPYRRLTPDDCEQLANAFEQHGRHDLLPSQ
jgi:fatty-acyl-CoA synthase